MLNAIYRFVFPVLAWVRAKKIVYPRAMLMAFLLNSAVSIAQTTTFTGKVSALDITGDPAANIDAYEPDTYGWLTAVIEIEHYTDATQTATVPRSVTLTIESSISQAMFSTVISSYLSQQPIEIAGTQVVSCDGVPSIILPTSVTALD